jgi:hypothetical protein
MQFLRALRLRSGWISAGASEQQSAVSLGMGLRRQSHPQEKKGGSNRRQPISAYNRHQRREDGKYPIPPLLNIPSEI